MRADSRISEATVSITIHPPEDGPFSVYDVDTMQDRGYQRIELHEGNIVMMAPATMWHSRTVRRLANALEATGRVVETEVGIKRSAYSTRIADVAVFHEEQTDLHKSYWASKEIALVIEVVSEWSEEFDRVIKPRWYAHEGIPEYWRVEEGENGEALIFRYKLVRTKGGEPTYAENGTITLSQLEAEARDA
jgi:Uma2 family endonuclease